MVAGRKAFFRQHTGPPREKHGGNPWKKDRPPNANENGPWLLAKGAIEVGHIDS